MSQNFTSDDFKSKSSRSRMQLSKLLREGGELLTVETTATILSMDNKKAAKSLARWRSQGWLAHIKRGVYVAVPIESESSTPALEDEWILVPELFEPGYIGGWSAAEHWDLTEQIFRDIAVFTAKAVVRRDQIIHNIQFVVTHSPAAHHFGTKIVWVKNIKILISDPTKTIVDMLSTPRLGGGIQHLIDCLTQYFKSQYFNDVQLIEYAKQLDNGAIFKRLGYLASQILGDNHPLVDACQANMSQGKAQLDPTLKGTRLITKWRLFVPAGLHIGDNNS